MKPKYSMWRNDETKYTKIAVIYDCYKLIYDLDNDSGELFALNDKDELNDLYELKKGIVSKMKNRLPNIE